MGLENFPGAAMIPDTHRRDVRPWLMPLAAITMVGVGAGILADSGLPAGIGGPLTVGLLAMAAGLSAVALSARVTDLRVVLPALVGVGLCGAGVAWWSDGGFVIGYVALVGLALRLPRRAALLGAAPVMAAIALAEAHDAAAPVEAIMSVLLGFGFLFITTAFAAVSRDARRRAEQMLAHEAALRAQQEALREQEAAASEARAHAAALAERSRLAHELHDVLAHSLAALSVQLEAIRLTAIGAGAGAELVGQIGAAHRLTRIGMLNARRAPAGAAGRGNPRPGQLAGTGLADRRGSADAHLVPGGGHASASTTGGRADGVPGGSRGAHQCGQARRPWCRCRRLLTWAPAEIGVLVCDSGGDGADAGLPSSGLGLAGMAERAARYGGRLDAGPGEHGFTIRLRLPLRPAAQEPADVAC
jgi:signal transduction histidine kinase